MHRRALTVVAVVGWLPLAPVGAQTRWFPAVQPFEYPASAQAASGVVGRIIWVRRPESLFGLEQEGDVSVGENVPVVRLGDGDRAPFLGLTIRVTGRFSLDDPKSALISNDWVVGAHAVADRGPTRLAVEVFHESSHLGDEYAERFGVRRSDWTREAVALWLRHGLGSVAVSAKGTYTVIGGRGLKPATVGIGAEYRRKRPSLGTRLEPSLSVFTESVEDAGWKMTTSGRVGVDLVGATGRVGLGLVYLNGLSSQRQFYGIRSRYYGFELRFDF